MNDLLLSEMMDGLHFSPIMTARHGTLPAAAEVLFAAQTTGALCLKVTLFPG
jgi:hypothetical protein